MRNLKIEAGGRLIDSYDGTPLCCPFRDDKKCVIYCSFYALYDDEDIKIDASLKNCVKCLIVDTPIGILEDWELKC